MRMFGKRLIRTRNEDGSKGPILSRQTGPHTYRVQMEDNVRSRTSNNQTQAVLAATPATEVQS